MYFVLYTLLSLSTEDRFDIMTLLLHVNKQIKHVPPAPASRGRVRVRMETMGTDSW